LSVPMNTVHTFNAPSSLNVPQPFHVPPLNYNALDVFSTQNNQLATEDSISELWNSTIDTLL